MQEPSQCDGQATAWQKHSSVREDSSVRNREQRERQQAKTQQRKRYQSGPRLPGAFFASSNSPNKEMKALQVLSSCCCVWPFGSWKVISAPACWQSSMRSTAGTYSLTRSLIFSDSSVSCFGVIPTCLEIVKRYLHRAQQAGQILARSTEIEMVSVIHQEM